MGDYTLVAYIATADGIRASQYVAVTDVAISNFPLELQNLSLSATKDGNGATVVSYQYLTEFTLQLTAEKLNYKQFAEQVYQLVFEYGTPAEVIEVQLDGAFVALTGLLTGFCEFTSPLNGLLSEIILLSKSLTILVAYAFAKASL